MPTLECAVTLFRIPLPSKVVFFKMKEHAQLLYKLGNASGHAVGGSDACQMRNLTQRGL